jgi:hypothetical protein
VSGKPKTARSFSAGIRRRWAFKVFDRSLGRIGGLERRNAAA